MIILNNNNKLNGSLIISKPVSTIECTIQTFCDKLYIVRIKHNNKVCASSILNPISADDHLFAGVIRYNEDMKDTESKYTCDITIGNGDEWIYSNEIPVNFLREKIHGEIVEANMSEILSIKKELATLSKKIDIAFSGRIPKAIPEFKMENVKKGMIPTVISDDGHIAFTYPFSDIVNEINNKKSVMRSITLDTKDLKLNGEDTNLDDLIKAIRENQKKESEILRVILHNLSELTSKVAALDATLVDFRNNQ